MDIIPPNAVTLAGPLLVGYLMSWALYGVLSVQVFVYYLAFPNDLLYVKILVYAVYLLETVQSIIVAHDAFRAYAENFGSWNALTDEYFIWLTMPVIGGVAACLVQFFYAYRIRFLSNSRIPSLLIAILAVIQCGSSIATGILSAQVGNLLKLDFPTVKITQGVWGGVSAACDVAIAVCMSIQLSRRESSFPSTQAVIVRILRLMVGTGSLTAIIAIVNLALFNGIPSHTGAFFLTPGVLLGKMYSNSMMVVLNSRLQIVGGRNIGTQSVEIMLRPSLFRQEDRRTQLRSVEVGDQLDSDSPSRKVDPYGHHTGQGQKNISPIEIDVTHETVKIVSEP